MAGGALRPGSAASRLDRAASALSLGPGRAMTVTMRSRLGWAVATALGLAAGSTAGSLAVGAVARPLSPLLGGLVYVAAYGAVIGAIAAVVQLAAMPRGLWHWSVWLAANA